MVVFGCFIFKYEVYSKGKNQEDVESHAKVVASAVWTLFTPLTEHYLTSSVRNSGYKKVSITTLNDLELFSYENKLSGIDRYFQSIGIIRTGKIATPIIYKSQPIGTLTIEVYNKRIYIYSYVAVVLLLVLALIWFMATINEERKSLRVRIREKTKDLRTSEERFQRAMAGTRDGLWDWNLQTNEAYMSDRFSTMLGYEQEDLPSSGDAWISLIHPDDLVPTQATLRNYLEKKVAIYESTFRMRAKDGTYRWFTGRGEAVWDQDGTPMRITGVNTDITERKRTEQELLKSELKFRVLLNNQNDAIFLHKALPRGLDNFTEVNDRAVKHYGCSYKEFLQLTPADITVQGKTTEQIDRSAIEQLDSLGHATFELTHLKKTGEKFQVEVNAAFIELDNQKYILSTVRDITERLEIEDQLRQKYKMEAVGVMAGGMAHNFNNNLAIILGNLELSKMKLPGNPEIGSYLNNATIAVLRSRDLIKQIMSYSRQDGQDKNSFELPLLIDETLQLLRATIPTTINLHKQVSDNCRTIAIHADFSQLQECLINLCNNAMQAMDETGD